MNINTRNPGLILLLAVFLFSGCGSEPETPATTEIQPDTLSTPSLFLDFEQDGLAQPFSIEMLDDNRIALLDIGLNEILVFNETGQFDLRFGGEGRGPGEFTRPLYIDFNRDYINVIDTDQYRVSQFSYSGDFVQSFNFEGNPNNRTMTVTVNGNYFTSSGGENGSLIKYVNVEDDTVQFFGEALGEANPVMNLEVANQSLINGEIPEIFKNDVTLYHEGEYLYVFLDVYSRVQKYSADGELIWETEVNLPINEIIFENTRERARDAPPGMSPSLSYVINIKVVDGNVFLLWRPLENHSQQIVRLNEEGSVTDIYRFPEGQPVFFDFAINSSTNTLYLTAPGLGQVYQTQIPR